MTAPDATPARGDVRAEFYHSQHGCYDTTTMFDEITRLRAEVQALRDVEADAKRWRLVRRYLTINCQSLDADGNGPFRHYLRIEPERLLIPGSGNVEPIGRTNELLDAAIDARGDDCNAYIRVFNHHTRTADAAKTAQVRMVGKTTPLATRLDRLIDVMRLHTGTTRARAVADLAPRLGISVRYLTNLVYAVVWPNKTKLDIAALGALEAQYDAALRARVTYESACRHAALVADRPTEAA